MTSLFRGPVLWVAEQPAVRRLMTELPMGRRLAGRFVAGDDLDAGIRAARALGKQGIGAMLDHLGENVDSPAGAAHATDGYVRALKRIQEHPDLDCNLSVKLTQLGLDLGMDACLENMERVLEAASAPPAPILVMIDMEASPYVDRTLEVYLSLRERHPNVGVCLQAYLYRTAADAQRIAGPSAIVRVCKGAYLEPPDIAYASRSAVRTNFSRVAATLLARGSTVHFATHDPRLVEGARAHVRSRRTPPSRFEFQMLYGIRRDLQSRLLRGGEPVRVYVPYGLQWYPYLTRRLAERPANVWFFVSNLVRWWG